MLGTHIITQMLAAILTREIPIGGKYAELAKRCHSVPKAEAVNSCWQSFLFIDGH